jgi:small subunit ribosomal protein S17
MIAAKKKLLGDVVSDKMNKTVVVRVETLKRHSLYHKTIKHIKRYKAHDEENKCRVGDRVLIVESRPLSKEKSWVVEEILQRAEKEAIPATTQPEVGLN